MKRHTIIFLTMIAACASAACFEFSSKTTPSSGTSQTLAGAWATTESLPGTSGSLQDACVNFKWAVTQINGTSGSGTFSATCLGNMQVTGSASGTLVGSTLNWSANATGTVPNQSSCTISLTGSATLEANNKIRIPYQGTTCLGPVSGTEVITR
jgi:hypothetical protein